MDCFSKRSFKSHKKISDNGNPFLEISKELFVLHTLICVAENCVKMMKDVEKDVCQNKKDILSSINEIKFLFFKKKVGNCENTWGVEK